MASKKVLNDESSSDSESSLDDGTHEQSQVPNFWSTEDDYSSELELDDDLRQSLSRKPRKKRRRYGSGSAKGKLHPSNGHTFNSTTAKPYAAGKENQPVTPTTRKKKVGESSRQPKESTSSISKKSALYRVRSRIQNSAEPTEPDDSQSNEPSTCEELRKTNELLAKLISQVSKTQRRVAALEEKLDTSISSSTSSGSSKKRSKSVGVPKVVKRETRRVYSLLENEDHDFEGWIIAPGVTFKSPRNQAALDKLMKEVKGLNSDFKMQDIREAAYRYYKSCSEQESIKRRGKAESMAQKKRAHERISRKLQERTAVLEKMTFSDPKKKDKWREALHVKLMSSEESAVEGDLEVIQVKPLLWRSEAANDIIRRLDDRILSDRSPQSRRQAKKRIQGENSSRSEPLDELPAWLFN